VRALNDERRELLRRPTMANWEKARSESIVEQIPHLLARAKLVRNSVFMLYLGTLLFLLSSALLASLILVGSDGNARNRSFLASDLPG